PPRTLTTRTMLAGTASYHLPVPEVATRACWQSPTDVYWSPGGGQDARILVVRRRCGWGIAVGAWGLDRGRGGTRGRLPPVAQLPVGRRRLRLRRSGPL